MKLGVTLTEGQVRYLDRLKESGVYGNSRQAVVNYLLTKGIEGLMRSTLIGSGTQGAQEQASTTHRSAAPE